MKRKWIRQGALLSLLLAIVGTCTWSIFTPHSRGLETFDQEIAETLAISLATKGRIPTRQEEDWRRDSWGRTLRVGLGSEGATVVVHARGGDGIFGTVDDIIVEERFQR